MYLKRNFSIEYLNKRLLQNFVLGMIVAIATMLAVWGVSRFIVHIDIKWELNLSLIIILLLTGVCRTIYSILSAGMGAIGNYKMIRYTNVLTILFFIILLVFNYIIGFSLMSVTVLFLTIWVFRCFVYYYYLRKYEV